jgi:hypothetical protein
MASLIGMAGWMLRWQGGSDGQTFVMAVSCAYMM